MRLAPFIAKRYLRSKSSTNAINIITGISVSSIIVSTAVLFIVLSAFSGLRAFNLNITSVIAPDLKVLPKSGKTLLTTSQLEQKLSNIDGILTYSRVIEERAFLTYKGKSQLAVLKGVDTEFTRVNPIRPTLLKGEWPAAGAPEVVVGLGVFHSLSLSVNNFGELLKVMVPKPGKGQIINPSSAYKSSKAITSGVFQVGEGIDETHIFSDLDFAAALLDYDADTVSAIEIRLTDTANEKEIRAAIEQLFNNNVVIKNRIQLNDALYKMLNTENLALYFICTLVMIIALFSFMGSIIMIILDKRKNIKTLINIGVTLSEARNIFLYQGILMVSIGTFLGICLGVFIVGLQLLFKIVRITETLPYPMAFEFSNVVIVACTALTLGTIAAKIASNKITYKLIKEF